MNRWFVLCGLSLLVIFAGCQPTGHGEAMGASVLLLSADSLRVDRLPHWNPEAAAQTPQLDRLIARGTTYRNAWATSPWTAPSMVSLMTGLYPPSHGVVYRDDTTPPATPTLPRLLVEQGYQLGNFSFFSQISYFRNLGLGPAVPGLTHATVASAFDKWLGKVDGEAPFFAWVHLLETHLPYGASGYRATEVSIPGSSGLEATQLDGTVPIGTVEFEDGDRDALLELYDRDVRAMDVAIGTVLDALEAHGRLENTLIIFVADHGEELLEDGWVGHASTAVQAKLLEEILRVPLVLAGPGIPIGESREDLVQQVDVLPTLLHLLGLEPTRWSDGEFLPGIVGQRGPRDRVYFDTSPGGNLTPQELRGERLQGISDGRCFVESPIRPGNPPSFEPRAFVGARNCDESVGALKADLTHWREDQAAQHLDILSQSLDDGAPSPDEIGSYDEVLAITNPSAEARLEWRSTGGQLRLQWTGEETGEFWLDYRLGSGLLAVEGRFRLDGRQVMFGPVPEGYWNDLATYSPFHIRVVDTQTKQRSPWITFEVLESR